MQQNLAHLMQTYAIITILATTAFFPMIHSFHATPDTPLNLDTYSWWNPQWPYRKLLSINHTKVSGDLTDFPVLITWSSDSEVAAAAQPAGQDLVFVCYDDNLTKLNHELESYNATNGALVAWVNVASVSATVDTMIWMYYGNPSCGPQHNITGTWDSDYVLVQHLNETGTTMYDSTAYQNDGVSNGTNFTLEGKIDGAQLYNGNDKIVVSNVTHSPDALTVEAWVYRDTTDFIYIACKGIYSLTSTDWILYLRNNQPADQGIDFSIRNHSSYIRKGDTPVGCWFYLSATYENGSAALYYNGTQIGTGAGWPVIPDNFPHLGLGNDYLGNEGSVYPMTDVRLDEVRLSKIARSSSWIATCYANQNNPGSFFSVGAEQRYEYTLTTQSDPPQGGTITASPDPPYYYNDVVTLTAVANQGYTFHQWSGDLSGDENPASLLIDGNKSVTALFIYQNTPPVAVNDTATVFENSTDNQIDVLANDYDPDGDTLTITAVTQPASGVSSHDDAYAYYTPQIGYIGSDFFTYTITDGHGGNASASVFITVVPLNSPPYPPSHPIPENGQTNVSIMTMISWTGGDPDPDDIVLYDVYFGTTPSPELVSANQSTTIYDPGTLAYDTTYYWRIVAWDTHNASTKGDLWQFTTQSEEHTELTVTITRPLEKSFYLRNRRLFSLPRSTVVYGPITITAEVTSESAVKHVEFYVDGRLKKIDLFPPYTYRWAPLRCFNHVITVKAYDVESNTASDEITVFKWRLHPVIIIGGLIVLDKLNKC